MVYLYGITIDNTNPLTEAIIMDNTPLLALLESDKDMILGNLRADRSPQAAQATLEKAIDRLSLRCAEQQTGDADDAQLVLKTLRSAFPLVDAVGEVHRWEKTVDLSRKKPKWRPLTLGLLATGVVLVLAVMLGLLLTGGRLVGALAFLEALIPAALGMAALFFAGLKAGQPEPVKSGEPSVREEFLIDPDRVWHHLRGMVLMADSALENARVCNARKQQENAADTTGTKLDAKQAELFGSLLEIAYAHDDSDSREMIESIGFYLHGAGVETVDYSTGNENWFEFLPAPTRGTLRPALVAGEKVVKKGLAAR